MSDPFEVQIQDFPFERESVLDLEGYERSSAIYLLHDKNKIYVGESTNVKSRLVSHLRNNEKKELTSAHIISCPAFNMSVAKDLESKLIKYFSGDGKYKILNRNDGIDHDYYQKELYEEVFDKIWIELRTKGLAIQSRKDVDNSDLSKYSPYKSLTGEQKDCIGKILLSIAGENTESVLVNGGAGTGKTVLATYLLKLLSSPIEDLNFSEFSLNSRQHKNLISKWGHKKPEMALVIAMTSLRKTMKNVFRQVDGLRQDMVIGPGELTRKKYDIVVVDEAHRLRRRKAITNYGSYDSANKKLGLGKNANELDWVIKQGGKHVLFYDIDQSIKPSDVSIQDFNKLARSDRTQRLNLRQQMRCEGGVEFQEKVHQVLNVENLESPPIKSNDEFEFYLFDDPTQLINNIKEKDQKHGLSRAVAGFSWKWTKKDTSVNDIILGERSYKWNTTNEDWINTKEAPDEIGCIHTVQGYDLNYVGVIFGHEITFNWDTKQIEIIKDKYFDPKGKQSTSDQELKDYIVNIYKTILLRGIKGVYVYACDESMQRYLKKHIETNKCSIID